MNKRAKIIKFVNSNKKQIIFALFALLYFLNNNKLENVYMAAAPAVAAAAAKVAKAAKAVKTAKTAKQAGETAKAAKEIATAARNANEAASTIKQARNAKNPPSEDDLKREQKRENRRMLANAALTAATGVGGLGLISKAKNKIDMPNKNQNMPKNTNPNPEAFSNKKDNSTLSQDTSSIKARGGLRNLFRGGNTKGETDSINMDNASEISKGKGIPLLGCGLGTLVIGLLIVPIIFFSIISNTFTAANYLMDTVTVGEENTGFLSNFKEKFVNFFEYHYFASNKDTFINEINSAYEDAYRKYGVPIDIPLLLSTILTDTDSLVPVIDDNNQMIINKETMEKLKYVEDLIELQIDEGDDIYLCSSKEVDGKTVYYQVLYSEEVPESSIISGSCNASNVGKYIRSTSTKINTEKYYEKLENNVVLTLLYPDYEESKEIIINKIKNQYEVFELMYMNSDDENGLPSDLLYDSEVNMRAPLRGTITVTSPFGNRGNVYKNGVLIATGGHNAMDLYASDKTIYAAGKGVVYRTYYANDGGNTIELLHTTMSGKRYISQYVHLSQILVSANEEVNTGDVIGIMGCTGNACTGTHLHFGIKDFDTNEWYNPKAVVERTFN